MTELSCPTIMDTIISFPFARFKRAATIHPNTIDSAKLKTITKKRADPPSSIRSTEITMAAWAEMAPTTIAKFSPIPQVTGKINARVNRMLRINRVYTSEAR